jgi:hypothetical protein
LAGCHKLQLNSLKKRRVVFPAEHAPSFVGFVNHLQHLDCQKPEQSKQRICMGSLLIFRNVVNTGVDSRHRSVFLMKTLPQALPLTVIDGKMGRADP